MVEEPQYNRLWWESFRSNLDPEKHSKRLVKVDCLLELFDEIKHTDRCELLDIYNAVSNGRYSIEKNHEELIEAIRKYENSQAATNSTEVTDLARDIRRRLVNYTSSVQNLNNHVNNNYINYLYCIGTDFGDQYWKYRDDQNADHAMNINKVIRNFAVHERILPLSAQRHVQWSQENGGIDERQAVIRINEILNTDYIHDQNKDEEIEALKQYDQDKVDVTIILNNIHTSIIALYCWLEDEIELMMDNALPEYNEYLQELTQKEDELLSYLDFE